MNAKKWKYCHLKEIILSDSHVKLTNVCARKWNMWKNETYVSTMMRCRW